MRRDLCVSATQDAVLELKEVIIVYDCELLSESTNTLLTYSCEYLHHDRHRNFSLICMLGKYLNSLR